MNRSQIWYRETEAGHWLAYVAEAPRIEGRGLTKDEALGALVRENAARFAIVMLGSMDASDIMASDHGAPPHCIEVCGG